MPARFVTGWVSGAPITTQFLALPDDRKQAFIADIIERVATYVDDAGLAVPMENHFLTASKSAAMPPIPMRIVRHLQDRWYHCAVVS